MKKRQHKRRRFFVDRKVQGSLAIRVGIYWFCCLVSVALFSACWIAITQGPQSSMQLIATIGQQCGPVFVASLVLLPAVVVDCIRQSNKFAGPMLRIRRAVNQLANGESVPPIHLRKGDFWSDVAADLNRVAARLEVECGEPTTGASRTQPQPPGVTAQLEQKSGALAEQAG